MDYNISRFLSSIQIKISCGNLRHDIYVLLSDFHPEAVAPYIVHKRQITVIYRIRFTEHTKQRAKHIKQ